MFDFLVLLSEQGLDLINFFRIKNIDESLYVDSANQIDSIYGGLLIRYH